MGGSYEEGKVQIFIIHVESHPWNACVLRAENQSFIEASMDAIDLKFQSFSKSIVSKFNIFNLQLLSRCNIFNFQHIQKFNSFQSCEDMRCLGDDTDVTEGGRQGLATGRRVEVSKEWVVFKLNNHYTRVHCTSGAGGGEDGEKENDEGKNKDACNGGATQTADGGGGGGRGGDDVSGGGGGGGGGVEACRVENFPWFPGKDNFSTFSKVVTF